MEKLSKYGIPDYISGLAAGLMIGFTFYIIFVR